jgi:hypothetical protein
LAISMATAAILRKNQPLRAQLHMAYDIPTRFHKIWSRHLREIEQAKMCGRIRIIVKNKHRITIHHPQTDCESGWCNNKKLSKSNMSPKLRLGAIIIIRNGANTICLPNFVRGT